MIDHHNLILHQGVNKKLIMKAHAIILLRSGLIGICALAFASTEVVHAEEAFRDEQKPADKDSLKSVLAEGRGVDETAALKDAFRNAVAQVLGLIVYAETQVEHDEITKEQILTASNGFIESYEKVSGGLVGGIYRVEIKAKVRSKVLIGKLEKSRVLFFKPNTKKLFAEVASDMQAVHGATKLLCELLGEVHNSWVANAGKPSFDRVSRKLTVPIVIAPDRAAYKASSQRLTDLLEKIAIKKKRKMLSAIPWKEREGVPTPGRYAAYFYSNAEESEDAKTVEHRSNFDYMKEWKGYKISGWLGAEDYDELNPHAIWIWLCTSQNAGVTEWSGYAVDVEMKDVAPFLCPTWSLRVTLKDGGGASVGQYQDDPLLLDSHYGIPSCDPGIDDCFALPGFHPHAVSMGDIRHDKHGAGLRESWALGDTGKKSFPDARWTDHQGVVYRQRVLIAPMFMSLQNDLNQNYTDGIFAYWTSEVISSRFEIDPDNILKVQDVEVKFNWTK